MTDAELVAAAVCDRYPDKRTCSGVWTWPCKIVHPECAVRALADAGRLR